MCGENRVIILAHYAGIEPNRWDVRTHNFVGAAYERSSAR